MGHFVDEAIYKRPHKTKTHRYNKLKTLVLVYIKILYKVRYKPNRCYAYPISH